MKRRSSMNGVPVKQEEYDPTSATMKGDQAEQNESGPSNPKKNQKMELRDVYPWTTTSINGLKPVCRTSEFTLDFNVFNDLVEASYHHLCDTLPPYSKNISMGMFSYYCGVALWYRLYDIRYAQGGDSEWLFRVMKSVDCPGTLILPKSFCKFLDMIGDFTEPNSSFYWKLVFPALNSKYHFGKMSVKSFPKYMAYPAPTVLIAALRQELGVITGKKTPFSGWKIKEIDYEDCPDDRVFTPNVCGYYVPPSAGVYNIGIDGPIGKELSVALDEFEAHKSSEMNSWIRRGMMTYISKYNESQSDSYPMQRYTNTSKWGSEVQMGFTVHPNGYEVVGFSSFMLPDHLSTLIPVFRLRARRNPRDKNAYPYDFPTVEDIPGSWPGHINATFDYGEACNHWNLGLYSTGRVDRRIAVTEYVQSFAEPGSN